MESRAVRMARREVEFKKNHAAKMEYKLGRKPTGDELQAAWARHSRKWWFRLTHYRR